MRRVEPCLCTAMPIVSSGDKIAPVIATEEGLRMFAKSKFVLLAIVVSALPALADTAPPDDQNGRFVFSKQGDGYVRLDTKSGEVALCNPQPVGWTCQAAPEDRAVLENEIARLRNENATLKKDLLGRGLPLPSGLAPPAAAQDQPSTLRLPNDADIEQMVAFFGRVWQRFVDAVERAQKQVFNKS